MCVASVRSMTHAQKAKKTLENNLVNFFKLTREQAKMVLAEGEIDEKARGETLSPQRLAKLSDVLLAHGFIKNA